MEKYTLFSAKASGFFEFYLKRPRPAGFSQQKVPITSTKSINNSAELCAEFEPAPQCARLTMSARKTSGWAFGQNYQVMSSGDQYSCIQSWTTKKRRKPFTNFPFVAVLAVSRSRLSVATATRSSSEGPRTQALITSIRVLDLREEGLGKLPAILEIVRSMDRFDRSFHRFSLWLSLACPATRWVVLTSLTYCWYWLQHVGFCEHRQTRAVLNVLNMLKKSHRLTSSRTPSAIKQ